MGPELSRRLGRALGARPVSPTDRLAVIDAAERVDRFEELPEHIARLVKRLEAAARRA
jgi:hypothetical protein